MDEAYDDRYSSATSTRYIKRRVSDVSPTLDHDDNSEKKDFIKKPSFLISALAGGIAGVVVDFTLYPLDTVKTRLQTEEGFRASGGFRKLYKGILPVVICSAPLSALFFSIYNSLINLLKTKESSLNPIIYIVSASAAELVCSSVRVPLEIVKQRKQTSTKNSFFIIKQAVQKEGFLGLYRGFSSTILREIPFASIQYPLWEAMIDQIIIHQNGKPLSALQTASCGAIAGAIAGALTTPVDVLKTRIMLAEKEKLELYKPRVYYNFIKEIHFERGIAGFFSGVTPRTLWIMFGGFIYFGAYEKSKLFCEQNWCSFRNTLRKLENWAPYSLQGKLDTILKDYECNKGTNLSSEVGDSLLTQEQRTDAPVMHNDLDKSDVLIQTDDSQTSQTDELLQGTGDVAPEYFPNSPPDFPQTVNIEPDRQLDDK